MADPFTPSPNVLIPRTKQGGPDSRGQVMSAGLSPFQPGWYAAAPVGPSIYDPDEPPDQRVNINVAIYYDRIKAKPVTDSVRVFRDYAAGKHVVVLTDMQRAILRGILNNDFCDNVCHLIISETEGRLTFRGWQCPDDPAVQAFLTDLYDDQLLASRSGEVHYDAARDGDHAIALGWCPADTDDDSDKGEVEIFREDWWDQYEGVFIGYNRKGIPIYACKEWWDFDQVGVAIKRRNVWFPDRLERYTAIGAGFSPTDWVMTNEPDDDDEVGGQDTSGPNPHPLQWLDPDGSAIGLPIVHFPNSARSSGNYGFSEIGGGVTGFQDQINDLQFAMSGAGRLTAFQMITIAGMKLEIDPNTGDPKPPKVGPGQVLISPDPNTRFGRIDAGDMAPLIDLYNQKLKSVSRVTRTPLHAITGGDWPSGEALLRSERPAVAKAERLIARFSNSWRMVAMMAIRIYNAFSMRPALREDCTITVLYDKPDKRDQLSKSIIVKNLQDFISNAEALRIMGYSPTEAQKIQDERLQEAQRFIALGLDPITGVPMPPRPQPEPNPAPGRPTPGQSNDHPNQPAGGNNSDGDGSKTTS